MTSPLDILYQDTHLVAINKPPGLLVHRSLIDKTATVFALQLLRDQIGQAVYPIHRLDKPTSGVLLFALSAHCAKLLSQQWSSVDKTYLAFCRGNAPENQLIDHPITTKPQHSDASRHIKVQSAQTRVRRLATMTLDVGFGKQAAQYPNTIFSLVEASPLTGRTHQIRKHLKHINHPIVGDTTYGKGDINRYFRQQFAIQRLLLHCQRLTLSHPYTNQRLTISANTDEQWQRLQPFL